MVDDDIQNIFVEGNEGYQKAKKYIKQLMPKQLKKLKNIEINSHYSSKII